MAQQPSKPATPAAPHKPASEPPKAANPHPASLDAPRAAQPLKTPEAGKAPPEPGLPIGAKPSNASDPQAVKFDPPPAPPRWDDPVEPPPLPSEWTPEPAIDPLAETPPEDTYVDGMPVAVEQRARAAWVEAHGMMKWDEETDERQDDDAKPKFQKDALAGGGAFISAGAQKQVPGVAPPAKRE
jgi:hypothetical protein